MRCMWICMARSPSPSSSAAAVSTMSFSCRSRMPSLSRTGRPKLSEMREHCAESGQASRTICSVVPLRSGTTRALGREVAVFLVMACPFFLVPEARTGPVPALPRARTDKNRRNDGRFRVRADRGEHGRLAAKQGFFSPCAGRGPAMSRLVRSGRHAARNAALKRAVAGSGPPEARRRAGTGLDIDMGTAGQVIITICRFIDPGLSRRRHHGHHDVRSPSPRRQHDRQRLPSWLNSGVARCGASIGCSR